MNKFKATLGLSMLTPEAKVTRAQGIHDAMQASGNFPGSSMPISYSTIQGAIDSLHTAIMDTNSGTATSTSYMHDQERMLVTIFNLIKAHVEYVANSTTEAQTIIISSGMQVSQNGGSVAVSELTLDALGNGKVMIRVPRDTSEKAFVYEMSSDNVSYTKVTSSSLAKITVSGQTAGSTIYVRYYSISKDGESAMSQVKSVMVT